MIHTARMGDRAAHALRRQLGNAPGWWVAIVDGERRRRGLEPLGIVRRSTLAGAGAMASRLRRLAAG